MTNRRLTAAELEKARELLEDIRGKLKELSGVDGELLVAYRRKVYKELTYDERSKPEARRRLKQRKREEQEGLCDICKKPLPESYAVLDRKKASDGYTIENTRLIHQECDTKVQRKRGYK